jgi:hypothetical protein
VLTFLRRPRSFAAAFVALVAIAGCSLPGGTSSSNGSSPAPGTNKTAHLSVDVAVSGAVSGSTHYEQDRPCVDCGIVPDCAALAKGHNGEFRIPGGDGKAKINGVIFTGGAVIPNYHGPGTYPTSSFSDQTLNFPADTKSEQTPFEFDPTHGSTVTATIKGDASGKFEMTGFMDALSRVDSGTITWTCQDK